MILDGQDIIEEEDQSVESSVDNDEGFSSSDQDENNLSLNKSKRERMSFHSAREHNDDG